MSDGNYKSKTKKVKNSFNGFLKKTGIITALDMVSQQFDYYQAKLYFGLGKVVTGNPDTNYTGEMYSKFVNAAFDLMPAGSSGGGIAALGIGALAVRMYFSAHTAAIWEAFATGNNKLDDWIDNRDSLANIVNEE